MCSNNTITMNIDCINHISLFMEPIEAVRIARFLAVGRLPRSIRLKNRLEIAQFTRWCSLFDTSRLSEVDMILNENILHPNDVVVGWVPPSVKYLKVSDIKFCHLEVPNTVEVLTLGGSTRKHIDLPPSIKKLTLNKAFMGSVRTMPAELEVLEIINWAWPWPDGGHPNRLDRLPDTIHTIYIGYGVPVLVSRWPKSLKSLTFHKNDSILSVWLDAKHAPIPQDVDVKII
jgi:hypothetical protein